VAAREGPVQQRRAQRRPRAPGQPSLRLRVPGTPVAA